MPRVTDHESQRGAVVQAVAELICEGGLAAASLRAVARRSRVSASQLVENWGGRDRMLALAATFFGRRWQESLCRRAETDGVGAFVPHEPDEIDDARVWLAFCELGRNQEQVGWSVETLREAERQMLDALTRHSLDEVILDQLVALVEGLRHARCTPGHPLTYEGALAVLADFMVSRGDGGTFGSDARAPRGRPCGR